MTVAADVSGQRDKDLRCEANLSRGTKVHQRQIEQLKAWQLVLNGNGAGSGVREVVDKSPDGE